MEFDGPGALIVGRPDVFAGAARACGLRILNSMSFDEVREAPLAPTQFRALLIAPDGDTTPREIEALIDGVDPALCLIVTTLPRLDALWASPALSRVDLLADPSDADLRAAIVLLGNHVAPHIREERVQAVELRRLSEEAMRIASLLDTLATNTAAAEPHTPPTAPVLRRMLRARRLRDRYFAPGLFADPAWDILLDLMAARLEGQDVAISSLCIAAAVPPTTALRWIREMLAAGLLVRHEDPTDGRRAFIALSDPAASTLAAYFAELARLDAELI